MDETFDRLAKAAKLMLELFPFLLYRLGVYAAVGVIMLLYWILALGICWIAWRLWELAGMALFLFFLAGNCGLLFLARSYLLYLVKAGYIACLSQVVGYGTFPPGMTQTQFAQAAVAGRFGEISVMSGVDALIQGTIRAFNASLEELASWIPIPGMDQLTAAVKAIVRVAAGNIDEAVLSLAFLRKDQTVWEASRDGVLLYVQNWKPILQVAVAVTLIDWICTAVLFIMLLVVIGLFCLVLIPASWTTIRALAVIVPLILTYVLRLGLLEPLVVTAVLITYHKAIKGQKVDPAWDEKLSQISDQFRMLKQRATQPV